MKITFLIGNGFDINLGLKTKYKDFVNHYKQINYEENTFIDEKNLNEEKQKKEHIDKFKKHIKENIEMWSNGELALGKYTNELSEGEGDIFSVCLTNFGDELSKYLIEQETHIDYNFNKEQIIKSFNRLINIPNSFSRAENNALRNIYDYFKDENYGFEFITFNYTKTLENCIEQLDSKILNSHFYYSEKNEYISDNIYHIHGDVEGMILGVNDTTQISNIDIFNCEFGDIYLNSFLKENNNKLFGKQIEEEVISLLDSSRIIYIYGMSIGETDKRWWKRLCEWLNRDDMRRLIIYQRQKYENSAIPILKRVSERKVKELLLSYGNFNKEDRKVLEDRIYIINDNIFKDIENIAEFE